MTGSILGHFEDWFKSRDTRIRHRYEDDVGQWAFVVQVRGDELVCAARSSYRDDDASQVSIMKRVAGRAQVRDGFVCLRVRDDILVFDPVAILAAGSNDEVFEDDRKKRGEQWGVVPVDVAVPFDRWFDGVDPATFGDITDY
jgi:hypothetical protein